MEKYNVTGMTCAACQARVEKAVNAVPGVSSCAVSLLTNSMQVEGTAAPAEIIKAVTDAGYGASLQQNKKAAAAAAPEEDMLKDTESPVLQRRLLTSLAVLLPLMYVSMGHIMWGWPLPEFFDGNHVAMGIYELIMSAIVMLINQHFFISGFKGIIHKSPNMDTLVALGSLAAFVYSVLVLFAMTGAVLANDAAAVMAYMHDFYFESAAMLVTLITFGKLLEAKSKGRTTDALKALIKLSPKTAIVLRNGAETTVAIDEVQRGDLFVVKPGAQIPVDGIVREGFSAVNEAAFTGESVPVEKNVGDTVSTATLNTNGYMVCEATRVGEDTALAKIIQLVSDAAATKAPIAKIADRVSGIFVPVVISISVLTFGVWVALGEPMGYALARAIAVLVISCPCALGLATPVAIMVGNGVAAKAGILFKTAAALEQTGDVQIVALDKTGTITTGQMQATDIIPAAGVSEQELLRLAAALEAKSEHPISAAITSRAEGLELPEVTGFKAVAGNGLNGTVQGRTVYGGNAEFIQKQAKPEAALSSAARKLAAEGKTPVFFAEKGKVLGLIAVADTIKPDSKEAIEQLKKQGLYVVMLTGDNAKTAKAIAAQVGVDKVFASVKPDGKEQIVSALMEQGKVAMVGDGINDAPALTKADVGIAIGAGTDIALDAADVVLTKSSIMDVAAAIRLSRATIGNIRQNLFWAFFYNIIGIPLAAGCFIAAFGWSLNPMFGAAAMSMSSFCVVTNALRLNLLKAYDAKGDTAVKNSVRNTIKIEDNNETEEKEMKISVKGMMCAHCEGHVKKALEKIAGIEEAVASHEQELVTLTTSGEVAEADIKAAIEDCGYEYLGIVK